MRYLYDSKTEALYLIVGENTWTTADIPLELVNCIHRWKSEGVIVTVAKKTRRRKAEYQLSHEAILHFRRLDIINKPDRVIELQLPHESMYKIRQETGINYYLLKKSIENLAAENDSE